MFNMSDRHKCPLSNSPGLFYLSQKKIDTLNSTQLSKITSNPADVRCFLPASLHTGEKYYLTDVACYKKNKKEAIVIYWSYLQVQEKC